MTGENGILTRASDASRETEIGEEEEAIHLAYSGVLADNNGTGVSAGELQDELRNNGYTNATVTDNGDGTYTVVFDSGREYTINTDGSIGENAGGGNTETGGTVVDGVTIPEGFYYVGGSKNTGLVISDNADDENRYKDQETVGTELQGNQYVWIPVDGILGEDGTIEDVTGSEKKILLGRYSFDSSGTPSEYSGSHTEENSRNTDDLLNYGNTIANDIEGFIDSVRENGGYYIARFEASQNTTTNKAESKYDKVVWNNITQPNAAIACQDLYTGVNSDLMNGYAWDTAILFVQKYSGSQNYSRQISLNTSLNSTGTTNDNQCNIYDMASNCLEWITETYIDGANPCSMMGDCYNRWYYTSYRDHNNTSRNTIYISFRPLLYL